MTNHPNRAGAKAPFLPPAELRQLIDEAAITQSRAAELCHASLRTMQQWIAGDRAMPRAASELLCMALVAHRLITAGDWMSPWVRPEFVRLMPKS